MTYVSEILFVDPSIDDIETILRNLRPGVEAIVLDREVPAARQIAAALDGVHDLDAIHVIAHGAPGRVNFSAGDWSLAMLDDEAKNLAAIGRVLAADGELRLWSCDTASGAAGENFIAALAHATGADVAASSGTRRQRRARWHLGTDGSGAPRARALAAHTGSDGGLRRRVDEQQLGQRHERQLEQ